MSVHGKPRESLRFRPLEERVNYVKNVQKLQEWISSDPSWSHFSSADIGNLDEMGVLCNESSKWTLTSISDKERTVKASPNRESFSVLLMANGDASVKRVYVAMKAKRFPVKMSQKFKECDLAAGIYTQHRVWFGKITFMRAAEDFIEAFRHPEGKRRLLVLDAAPGHFMTAELNDFFSICLKNNIWLLILPAHQSHQTQPADLAWFPAIKANLRRKMAAEHLYHVNKWLRLPEVVELTCQIIRDLPDARITSGFHKSGLGPPISIPGIKKAIGITEADMDEHSMPSETSSPCSTPPPSEQADIVGQRYAANSAKFDRTVRQSVGITCKKLLRLKQLNISPPKHVTKETTMETDIEQKMRNHIDMSSRKRPNLKSSASDPGPERFKRRRMEILDAGRLPTRGSIIVTGANLLQIEGDMSLGIFPDPIPPEPITLYHAGAEVEISQAVPAVSAAQTIENLSKSIISPASTNSRRCRYCGAWMKGHPKVCPRRNAAYSGV